MRTTGQGTMAEGDGPDEQETHRPPIESTVDPQVRSMYLFGSVGPMNYSAPQLIPPTAPE